MIHFFLELLGALSGVLLVGEGMRLTTRAIRRRIIARGRTMDDLYYESLEISIRWVSPTEYTGFCKAEIVSRQNGLDRIPGSVGPASHGTFAVSTSAPFQIQEAPAIPARDMKCFIVVLPRAYNKGQRGPYTFTIHATALERVTFPTEATYSATRRTDDLVLRAVFCGAVPENVRFEEHDSQNRIVTPHTRLVPIDPVSLEARHHVGAARPGHTYALKWHTT